MSVHRAKKKIKPRTTRTPRIFEVLLRETARKENPDPENIDNPVIAPRDYEVRQFGRVLELQNRDL